MVKVSRFTAQILIVVFFALSLSWNAFPHDLSDVEFIINHHSIGKIEKAEKIPSTRTSSEIRLFAMGTLRLYQRFISSQQMNVCVFRPSCSHFSTQSIRKYGFFCGVLMTSDRLMRCSGLAYPYYDVDLNAGLLIDPIEDHVIPRRVESGKRMRD